MWDVGGREGSEGVKKKGYIAVVEPHFNTLRVTCIYVNLYMWASSPVQLPCDLQKGSAWGVYVADEVGANRANSFYFVCTEGREQLSFL